MMAFNEAITQLTSVGLQMYI